MEAVGGVKYIWLKFFNLVVEVQRKILIGCLRRKKPELAEEIKASLSPLKSITTLEKGVFKKVLEKSIMMNLALRLKVV